MIDNYMMYKNLPQLDLHQMNRYEAEVAIKEFININYKQNNKLLIIIHGKGSYILKNKTHEILKRKKEVKTYKIDIFNDGQTIVELK